MILVCGEENREGLLEYLNREPVFHTFLLSDMEQYGFYQQFQTIYMQEEGGDCCGVFLKYYNNLILSGDEQILDYQGISGLMTDGITTVMGKAEIMEQVMKYAGKTAGITYNKLYVHKEETLMPDRNGYIIRFAQLEDVDRIYEFLMSFKEFTNLYSEKEMIENRIRSGEGIHVILEMDGQIAAHGNSAASTRLTCMMGGICVKEEFRRRGYAKEILRFLCGEIHRQEKIPCIFASESCSYSIFDELGFEVYGRWGVAQLVKREGRDGE